MAILDAGITNTHIAYIAHAHTRRIASGTGFHLVPFALFAAVEHNIALITGIRTRGPVFNKALNLGVTFLKFTFRMLYS